MATPTSHSSRMRLGVIAFIVFLPVFVWLLVPSVHLPMAKTVEPRTVTARDPIGNDEQATIDLFERSKASVVYITTRQQVMDVWTRNVMTVPQGTGSGFVWDDNEHVVTNMHVIAGASEAWVRLSDGRDYKASLVGVSPDHDLAVLRIEVPDNRPAPLPIGASHDLKVGQRVYAIGNPFGLDWTLTTGIVSALDRSLSAENGATIEHLVQTDAAINPGNSGGPLLDSAGRLIGINTAIYSPSGAYAGVGFAVPVDTVNRIVPKLIATGRYERPSLGVGLDDDLNKAITQHLKLQGVAVLRVFPNTGAAAAGLKAAERDRRGNINVGDIITEIDGKKVSTPSSLLSMLDEYEIGSAVQLTLLRDGKEVVVKVTLQGDQSRPRI
ncbi:MAG TPA: trypsin-like peptidase domain-containing protein [Steroidobacteraceae bacterium]|nr:trypsin-like peptidase domain-containing protein [Steroidobacteraceae bacterium]